MQVFFDVEDVDLPEIATKAIRQVLPYVPRSTKGRIKTYKVIELTFNNEVPVEHRQHGFNVSWLCQ